METSPPFLGCRLPPVRCALPCSIPHSQKAAIDVKSASHNQRGASPFPPRGARPNLLSVSSGNHFPAVRTSGLARTTPSGPQRALQSALPEAPADETDRLRSNDDPQPVNPIDWPIFAPVVMSAIMFIRPATRQFPLTTAEWPATAAANGFIPLAARGRTSRLRRGYGGQAAPFRHPCPHHQAARDYPVRSERRGMWGATPPALAFTHL